MKNLRDISVALLSISALGTCRIDRRHIVTQFQPVRNASSLTTPMQVGNGDFAFGADITGLQTFLPFNTMSSWGWHNRSLPTTPNQTEIDDFTGLDWWTHGRLMNYDMPNPAENDISNWLIQNPHKINLGRIGLWFNIEGATGVVSESDLEEKSQVLDLYTGLLTSSFVVRGKNVTVKTVAHADHDMVAFEIESDMLGNDELGVFFDYPYADGKTKFEAPFIGIWNATSKHTTTLTKTKNGAEIQHDLDATTYYTSIGWQEDASISRVNETSHQYLIRPQRNCSRFSFSALFRPSSYEAPNHSVMLESFQSVLSSSSIWWRNYWETGAFIDITKTSSPSAKELQRRIILSQYHLAINSASHDDIAQESGLTNNGWYGKFHLEMTMWHVTHWQLWNKYYIFDRSMPGMYSKFLSSSIDRAKEQGYEGARWGKMSDPTGRSAPGEINALLIWQQPHVMWFAEHEYLSLPTSETLEKWSNILVETADFMASYAWYNDSTNVYDLGPPMYPVGENTPPNATINPTFELAYWRFGLDIATKWMQRQNKTVPAKWIQVAHKLAPLPIQNGTYVHYEGIENMWTDPDYTSDHPGLIGIYGLLPPQLGIPSYSIPILNATLQKVYATYNLSLSYGWDFPLLAMTSARLGDPDTAVKLLLHDAYGFDDIGMPIGGTRVPTPYWPQSSGLLMAVGAMAGGWDGGSISGDSLLRRWPKDWEVEAEGFAKGL